MKTKKRRKSPRLRGSHTHGRGFKKKARGSGHQGGVGMSGTGKRGDQKKSLIINLYGNEYFGKDRALRAGIKPAKPKAINLGDIAQNIGKYEKDGKINLPNYKILANGEPNGKWIIIAHSASQSAIEKVSKAGGKIEVLSAQKKKEAKAEVKEKKKEEKKPEAKEPART